MLICHTRPKNVRYWGRGQGVYKESSLAFRMHAFTLHDFELTTTCVRRHTHTHGNIEESTVPRPQEVGAMQTQLL